MSPCPFPTTITITPRAPPIVKLIDLILPHLKTISSKEFQIKDDQNIIEYPHFSCISIVLNMKTLRTNSVASYRNENFKIKEYDKQENIAVFMHYVYNIISYILRFKNWGRKIEIYNILSFIQDVKINKMLLCIMIEFNSVLNDPFLDPVPPPPRTHSYFCQHLFKYFHLLLSFFLSFFLCSTFFFHPLLFYFLSYPF